MTEQNDPQAWTLAKLGKLGSHEDGRFVRLDITGSDGETRMLLVPFEQVNDMLVSLGLAFKMAIKDNAKRPGFNIAVHGLRQGLEAYGVGVGTLQTGEPMTVLHVETSKSMLIDLMIQPDRAEKLGNDLVQAARKSRKTKRVNPS